MRTSTILLFLFAFSTCVAQEPILSFSELVSIGLENNHQTHAAWFHAKKMAAAVGVAESEYYPSLGIEAYASQGRQFKFINGPDVSYTNIGADLILQMMLYDGGRTNANVRETQLALQAACWKTDWTLQRVIVSVLENAYSTLYAQEALKAYQETVEDAENLFKASKDLNDAGLKAITDVYTSQATLALAKMEAAQQKNTLNIQKGKLAISLGWDADTTFELMSAYEKPSFPEGSLSSLIKLAKLQRSDLMAQRARFGETKEKIKKAQAGFYPRLTFRGRGGADHYFQDKANPVHYNVSLNLEIPLFNGFETIYQARYACAESLVAQEEIAQKELDISLEVLTSLCNLEASQEMLAYAKDNLDSAMLAYEGVLEKYRAGKEGIADLSNTLRQLSLARIRYSDVKTRYLVATANLAYAVGTTPSQLENILCE